MTTPKGEKTRHRRKKPAANPMPAKRRGFIRWRHRNLRDCLDTYGYKPALPFVSKPERVEDRNLHGTPSAVRPRRHFCEESTVRASG
jgi:hypothetical protein